MNGSYNDAHIAAVKEHLEGALDVQLRGANESLGGLCENGKEAPVWVAVGCTDTAGPYSGRV